jgi:glycine cleavage system aminomethyltransferase T
LLLDTEPLTGPNTSFWPITHNGTTVGKVTSAIYSPRLEQNIALAMLAIEASELGTALEVTTTATTFSATVVERPFFDPKKSLATG